MSKFYVATEITPEDLEWTKELLDQAKICKAEANALEQAVFNKLQRKYEIDLKYGESINLTTGEITRVRLPNQVDSIINKTIDDVQATSAAVQETDRK